MSVSFNKALEELASEYRKLEEELFKLEEYRGAVDQDVIEELQDNPDLLAELRDEIETLSYDLEERDAQIRELEREADNHSEHDQECEDEIEELRDEVIKLKSELEAGLEINAEYRQTINDIEEHNKKRLSAKDDVIDKLVGKLSAIREVLYIKDGEAG